MNRISPFVFVVLACLPALASACQGDGTTAAIHLGGVSAETYYEDLERQSALPDRRSISSNDEWLSLVNDAHASGLESLSVEQREDLLAIAAGAYSRYVRDASYDVEMSDGPTASLFDVMARDQSGRFTRIRQREVVGEGILVGFPAPPVGLADAPDHVVALGMEDGSSRMWQLGDGKWDCWFFRPDSAGEALVNELFLSLWSPSGERIRGKAEDVGGRSAVPFIGPTIRESEVITWIDEETFWPVRYAFVSPAETAVVTLVEVNTGRTLAPPVQEPCHH